MKKLLSLSFFFVIGISAMAQNVGIGITTPDPSAVLDLTGTSKGFLMPRMTDLFRFATPSPAEGLMVYDSTNRNLYVFKPGGWRKVDFDLPYTGTDASLVTMFLHNTVTGPGSNYTFKSVQGVAGGTITNPAAIYGYANRINAIGIVGEAASLNSIGVLAKGDSIGLRAQSVFGEGINASGASDGIKAVGINRGVYGESSSGTGVFGLSSSANALMSNSGSGNSLYSYKTLTQSGRAALFENQNSGNLFPTLEISTPPTTIGLKNSGATQFTTLGGSGNQMVTVDNSGFLNKQNIPASFSLPYAGTDNSSISFEVSNINSPVTNKIAIYGRIGLHSVGLGFSSALYGGNAVVNGVGVLGEGTGSNSFGVYGFGINSGVYGSSTTGSGVYGSSTNSYGIVGESTAPGNGVSIFGRQGGFSVPSIALPAGVYGGSNATGGVGIIGDANNTNGTGVYGTGAKAGVFGFSSSGYGMQGNSNSSAGVYGLSQNSIGVFGQSNAVAPNGTGVRGSGNGNGVWGSSATGNGVLGEATANAIGVKGISSNSYAVYGVSTNSVGVYGLSTAATNGTGVFGSGSGAGVYGVASTAEGFGVLGENLIGSGSGIAIKGESNSPSGVAIYGVNTSATGTTAGVKGETFTSGGSGVWGQNNSAGSGQGVLGTGFTGVYGGSVIIGGNGVFGESTGGIGVKATASGSGSYALFASSTNATAARLSANSTGAVEQLLIEETENDFSRIKFKNTNTPFWVIGPYSSATGNAAAARFNIFYSNLNNGGGADAFIMDGNGNLTIAGNAFKPGGGSWNVPSDYRLKKNITQFADGLNVIRQINPINFEYNGLLNLPGNKVYTGIIAQDLQKAAPYMVEEMKGSVEKYLQFDPNAINYLLINAVKELDRENKELQKELMEIKQLLQKK